MSGKNDDLFMTGYDASRIAILEAKLQRDPENRQLRLQLANAMKRQQKSEDLLRASLGAQQIDVVDYRIIENSDRYAVTGISESLLSFQKALTALYDAASNGSKGKAKYSASVREKSQLFFDYAYPGSRGFMLSIKNEQDLFGGELDRAVDTFHDYLEISSIDDAIEASRTLGLAAVSELYNWSKVNSNWGYGVDYNWIGTGSRFRGRYVECRTFSFIKEIFDGAEDKEEDTFSFDGVLVGLDVATRRFHIAQPNGESLKGVLDERYEHSEKSVPHRYRSIIRQVTKRTPATGKSTSEYYLIALNEL